MQNNCISTSDISNLLKPITSLSTSELRDLIEGDGDRLKKELDFIINNSSKIKCLQEKKEQLIENNKLIAQFNLNRESSFNEMRDFLINLNEEVYNFSLKVQEKAKKLDQIINQNSLDTTLALMEASVAESEEESELIAFKFLNKQFTFDKFIPVYIEKRKTAHLRRIKCERFLNYLNKKSQQVKIK